MRDLADALHVEIPRGASANQICKAITKQRPDLMRKSWKNWLAAFLTIKWEALKWGAAGHAGDLVLGTGGIGGGVGSLYGAYKGYTKPLGWKAERERARALMKYYDK